jgi:hypothetical protein
MTDLLPIVASACGVLEQGRTLLAALDDEAYTETVSLVFSASIGKHYRHCLNQFQAVIEATNTSVVDYDKRTRGGRLENSVQAAREETKQLILDLQLLRMLNPSDSPIIVRCNVDYSGSGSCESMSTLGRELVSAAEHAIHHFALINVMTKLLGVGAPDAFGVAPSTLEYHSQARSNAS